MGYKYNRRCTTWNKLKRTLLHQTTEIFHILYSHSKDVIAALNQVKVLFLEFDFNKMQNKMNGSKLGLGIAWAHSKQGPNALF